MSATIFYSWQSDLDTRINRNFIEKALKKAARKASKELAVENANRNDDIDLQVDKDTKGLPGTPHYATYDHKRRQKPPAEKIQCCLS